MNNGRCSSDEADLVLRALFHKAIGMIHDLAADQAADAWGSALETFAAAAPNGWSTRTRTGSVVAFTGAAIALVNGIFLPSHHHDLVDLASWAERLGAGGPWSLQMRGQANGQTARLASTYGLTHVIVAPLMIRDLTAADAHRSGPNVSAVRVVRGADQEEYGQTLAEAKEVPRSVFEIFTRPQLLDRPDVHGYLASADGVGVATALTVQKDELVGIFNVGTVPLSRRQGLARAVTRAALAEAYRDGARFAYLNPTPAAERLYLSMGFKIVESWTVFLTSGS
jgi:GNAT superfamily N-acetyltransferase